MNGKAQKIETHPLKSLRQMGFDRGGKWFFQKKKSVTKKRHNEEGRKENLASGKLEKKGVKIKQNGIL